ncbi:methyltransferase type 11 [Planctomycetales bacterium ZRK34]|nr:methyltransferase type 11 [Planctomycetales bacterium ZRK34]
MQIVNSNVRNKLDRGEKIQLELGAGGKARDGYVSLDLLPLEGVDIVANLNEPLTDLPDNCVASLRTRHTLEHVQEFLPLMKEIHRIVAPGGRIEITVPHYTNPYYYSDPTHERFFGLYTFNYFVDPEKQPRLRQVPSFYTDFRFEIVSIRIMFYRQGIIDRIVAPILERIINRSFYLQDFYERRLASCFHAWQLRYILVPQKK